jgi:hypothetical protein
VTPFNRFSAPYAEVQVRIKCECRTGSVWWPHCAECGVAFPSGYEYWSDAAPSLLPCGHSYANVQEEGPCPECEGTGYQGPAWVPVQNLAAVIGAYLPLPIE